MSKTRYTLISIFGIITFAIIAIFFAVIRSNSNEWTNKRIAFTIFESFLFLASCILAVIIIRKTHEESEYYTEKEIIKILTNISLIFWLALSIPLTAMIGFTSASEVVKILVFIFSILLIIDVVLILAWLIMETIFTFKH